MNFRWQPARLKFLQVDDARLNSTNQNAQFLARITPVSYLRILAVTLGLFSGPGVALELQWPIKADEEPEPVAVETPAPPPKVAPKTPPPEAPAIQPFTLPTFDGTTDHLAPAPELLPFPTINTDEVFSVVTNCFPERIPWGLELKAVAGGRYTDQSNTMSTFDAAGLSKYYAGIVAEMPLYSASELNQERRAEYQRREQLAANTAALLQGLASIRRAWREIGLYRKAEQRSRGRIQIGVGDTAEQISYLEKVAQAYSKLDDARAAVDGARLALVGQCREETVEAVNDYLKALIESATHAKAGEL